jgi:hypothetical protein
VIAKHVIEMLNGIGYDIQSYLRNLRILSTYQLVILRSRYGDRLDGLDDPGSIRCGSDNSLFSTATRPAIGPTRPPLR